MAKNPWDDLEDASPSGGNPWDHLEDSEPASAPISQLESGARGLAQGALLGFPDEATGGVEALWEKAKGNPKDFGDLYEKSRDESRQAYKLAEQANPKIYGGSELAGAIGTAFVPGLNAGTGARLGATVGRAALQGGLAAAGGTENNVLSKEGLGDIGLGAGLGGVGGTLGYGIGKGIGKAADVASDISMASSKAPFGSVTDEIASSHSPGFLSQVLPKAASFFSGVDEDAARRQMLRPAQTKAAQGDAFGYNLGKQAVNETENLGRTLGRESGEAGQEFIGRFGSQEMPNNIASQIDDFLAKNSKSKMGFSSLNDTERKTLEDLSNTFKSGAATGEDIYKIRGYLDHVKDLAGKYDKDGTGPYSQFLMSLRGQADALADAASPRLDSANKALSRFKDDTSLLRGSVNESQAEGMINNLYGANKGAKQEAARRLFSPETMESAKDIAANKAFEASKRPGGDNYFRRGALAASTMGASEVVTNPNIWKAGLRTTGNITNSLSEMVQSQPQIFGKFAPVLQSAAQRGPQGLAATHFILQQTQPEYQKMMMQMNGQDTE